MISYTRTAQKIADCAVVQLYSLHASEKILRKLFESGNLMKVAKKIESFDKPLFCLKSSRLDLDCRYVFSYPN